jgi:hypothetical protein
MKKPVDSADEKPLRDEPGARDILKRAYESTYRWGRDFRGFEADLEMMFNENPVRGSVRAALPDEIRVALPDPEAAKWAENQIGMMIAHRAPRDFETSDGRYVLTLDAEDAHPLGRMVRIHGDGLDSRYRVKEGRIVQIHRAMGPVRFTINVQDAIRTEDGRFLNTRYIVYYFNPKGDLKQVDSFNDEPLIVEGAYLPGRRRLFQSEAGEVSVREMNFRNHRLI